MANQLSKHHQAMINALAAFQAIVLEHNAKPVNIAEPSAELMLFAKAFSLDMVDFLKQYGITCTVGIKLKQGAQS